MTALILSLIRTYVPIGVGTFIAWLVTLGVELTPDVEAGLVVALTGLLIGLYYTAVRFLESRWPFLSVLLGSSQMPAAYTPTGEPPANGPLAAQGSGP